MEIYDELFDTIRELVMRHSPSGVEREVDEFLAQKFAAMALAPVHDASGNLIVRIQGCGGGTLAITAHKDEIGAIVTEVRDDGRLNVRKYSGAFPWVYGEGVVDLLGDRACVSGVLSFGSRHVSHRSPHYAQQHDAPVKWNDVWVETALTRAELGEVGVRAGTRMVIGRHRKAPFRMKDHIASYTLDNKASVAILLALAARLREKPPIPDVYLVASAKEEVGAIGALYFTRQQKLDALIALEICPLASEYAISAGTSPVLLSEDSYGLYDERLNALIRRAAARSVIALQDAVISGFGSDASVAAKYGHVARSACLGFPTQNTHGYEIAHLGAIANCIGILEATCQETFN